MRVLGVKAESWLGHRCGLRLCHLRSRCGSCKITAGLDMDAMDHGPLWRLLPDHGDQMWHLRMVHLVTLSKVAVVVLSGGQKTPTIMTSTPRYRCGCGPGER
jgi:hypothetical protein